MTIELIALGERLEADFIDRQLGKTVDVIMEDDGTGYTGNYIRVRVPGVCGETIRVKLTGREETTALGIIE